MIVIKKETLKMSHKIIKIVFHNRREKIKNRIESGNRLVKDNDDLGRFGRRKFCFFKPFFKAVFDFFGVIFDFFKAEISRVDFEFFGADFVFFGSKFLRPVLNFLGEILI